MEKAPILRFGLTFALLMAVLYVLLAIPFVDRLLFDYLEANAWLSNLILNILGQGTHLSGVVIESSRFSIAIRRGCDAVEPTWLFCAAIAAFPSSVTRKLAGMGAGIVLLQLLNLLRIVTLYVIGAYHPSIFDQVHLEIWPVVFILVTILLFVGWRQWDREAAR